MTACVAPFNPDPDDRAVVVLGLLLITPCIVMLLMHFMK